MSINNAIERTCSTINYKNCIGEKRKNKNFTYHINDDKGNENISNNYDTNNNYKGNSDDYKYIESELNLNIQQNMENKHLIKLNNEKNNETSMNKTLEKMKLKANSTDLKEEENSYNYDNKNKVVNSNSNLNKDKKRTKKLNNKDIINNIYNGIRRSKRRKIIVID